MTHQPLIFFAGFLTGAFIWSIVPAIYAFFRHRAREREIQALLDKLKDFQVYPEKNQKAKDTYTPRIDEILAAVDEQQKQREKLPPKFNDLSEEAGETDLDNLPFNDLSEEAGETDLDNLPFNDLSEEAGETDIDNLTEEQKEMYLSFSFVLYFTDEQKEIYMKRYMNGLLELVKLLQEGEE